MRQGYGDGLAKVEGRSDAVVEARDPEDPLHGETAHRNDDRGTEQAQLPVEPEPAELDLARRRGPIPATRRMTARIAARHGDAVEGLVELLFVELEPPPKRPTGSTAPRPALLGFDDSGSLADDHRPLAGPALEDGQRLERESFLGARPANAVVPL